MALSRSSLFAATAAVTVALAGVKAQTGNPSAATGLDLNKPTKSWSQWQPKPTYAYSNLPDQYMGQDRGAPTESGYQWDQTGYNTCLQGENSWNSNSSCQTAWVNSVDDWCIWGPPVAGVDVGSFEREAVAYCTQPTHGTRLIPDGTLTGVHFVKTRDYVQVTGTGNFTNIGIPEGDTGGEMDPHGADDLSNPIGGVVYTTAHPQHQGEPWFVTEWTNFMSWNQFCIRACWGERQRAQCQHIYDVLGCAWNIPANYNAGFETCDGDIAMIQGEYISNGQTSTFQQGHAVTPDPHPAPSSSQCSQLSTVSNGGVLLAQSLATTAASTSSLSSSAAAATSSGAAQGVSTMSRGASSAATPAGTAANAAATGGSTSGATSLQGGVAAVAGMAVAALVGAALL